MHLSDSFSLYLENFVLNNISSTNVVLIGRRNVGKTSFLKRLAIIFAEKYLVVVLDSATQHKEKSLIKKLEKVGGLTNHFLFFDVSAFLEKSLDLNSDDKKIFFRNLYMRQIENVLTSLHDLRRPCILIFDEIDFDEKIISRIDSLNSSGIFFLAAVHDLTSLCNFTHLKIFNLDRARLDLNLHLHKESKILAPNCCLEISASIFYNKHCRIPTPLFHCADLAVELELVGIPAKVFCDDTSTYDDFKNFAPARNFPHLKKFTVRPLDFYFLHSELSANSCGIYCLDSKLFFDDDSMCAPHFVVAFKDSDCRIILLNPLNTVVNIIRDYPLHIFISACQSIGSWRILLGRPT